MSDGRIDIQIQADVQDVKKQLNNIQKDVSQLGKNTNMQKSAVSFIAFAQAVNMASSALRVVVGIGKDLIDSYKAQEQATARLNSVLKATGNTIGMTSEELQAFASEMQNVSVYGDEAYVAVEQMFIATQSLNKDGLKRAVELTADLASAMGTDLTQSAQMLQMALQDPENGLTRLRRSGIAFNDEEKELIKTLAESGKMMEAQGKILDKLEGKYKGTAKAVAETGTGQLTQIYNLWGDIKEDLGRGLLDTISPALDSLYQQLAKLKGWSESNSAFQASRNKKADLSAFSIDALKSAQMQIELAPKYGESKALDEQWARIAEAIRQKEEAIKQKEYENAIAEAKKLADLYEDNPTQSFDPAPTNDVIESIQEQERELETLGSFLSANADLSKTAQLAEIENQLALAKAWQLSANYSDEEADQLAEIISGLEEEKKALLDVGNAGKDMAKKLRESFAQVASYIGQALSSIASFRSAEYDNEIENLENQLEARKEAGDLTIEQEQELQEQLLKKKKEAFEADKKNSIAQALINGAVGVTKCLEQEGWLGIVTGALVTATTAMQVATISQQKFQGYERGGIVGGAGITGDNHMIFANAGELILTKAQQNSIASQLSSSRPAQTTVVEFSGNVFGDDRTIASYVYDAIRTAQYHGEIAKWA